MNKVASEKATNDEQNNSFVLVAECVNNPDSWTNERESNLTIGGQYIVELAVIFSSRTIVKLKGMDRMFNSVLFNFYVNEKPFSLIGDARPYLELKEWSAAYVDADPAQIGLAGSPTKVKGIVNVVFQAKESKRLDGRDQAALEDLIKELITNHTIG